MPTSPFPTHRKAAKLARLQCDIDAEAMALVREACTISPTGRKLGLARVLNMCIYAYLGGQKLFGKACRSD
jgi:hypothetical protein